MDLIYPLVLQSSSTSMKEYAKNNDTILNPVINQIWDYRVSMTKFNLENVTIAYTMNFFSCFEKYMYLLSVHNTVHTGIIFIIYLLLLLLIN